MWTVRFFLLENNVGLLLHFQSSYDFLSFFLFMRCIIVSFLLLHILPTAYPVPRSQLLRNTVILNLFSPCTAYRLASYIRYTTTLNLLFPRTALRVPRSQPISLTHSMWRRILQLLKAEWNGTIHFSISNTLKWRVLSNVKRKSSKLCLFWLVRIYWQTWLELRFVQACSRDGRWADVIFCET